MFSWCPQFAFIHLLSGGGRVQTATWCHRGPGSETCRRDMKASHRLVYVKKKKKKKRAEHASHSVRRKTHMNFMVAGVSSMLNSATGTPLAATWGANMAAGYTTEDVPTCKQEFTQRF